jgi:hypothetical protein
MLSTRKASILFYASLRTSSSTAAFVGSAVPKLFCFVTTTGLKMAACDTLRGILMVPVSDAIRLHAEKDVKFVDGSWFLGCRDGRHLPGERRQLFAVLKK